MWQQLLQQVQQGNVKALARVISLVENEAPQFEEFLQALPASGKKIIGITGPPGAGKSTLADAIIRELVKRDQSVAVLCVDPSSPFNLGALLGDRIRMSEWYNNPKVFIRSLATRGSLGGLHPKIIEISDLLRAAPFDHIIIETVGVGQSEIEIAGLADTTLVVMVPEGGDEIQSMKAGMMEIADIFVVNKADRPDADMVVKNLTLMLSPAFSTHKEIVPVLKTIASANVGIEELVEKIFTHQHNMYSSDKRFELLAERAYRLIQERRMKDVDKNELKERIKARFDQKDFNLYQFLQMQ